MGELSHTTGHKVTFSLPRQSYGALPFRVLIRILKATFTAVQMMSTGTNYCRYYFRSLSRICFISLVNSFGMLLWTLWNGFSDDELKKRRKLLRKVLNARKDLANGNLCEEEECEAANVRKAPKQPSEGERDALRDFMKSCHLPSDWLSLTMECLALNPGG